jgi:hypothetical protein
MIMYTQQNTEPTVLITGEKISRKRCRSQLQHSTSEQEIVSKKRRVSVVSSVGFNNTVEILPSTSTSNANDWYSNADAVSFRANVKRDVLHLAQLLQQNRLPEMDQAEYCSVGVERYCCAPATRNQAKAMKEQRVRAVLQQQAQQKSMGISDPEAIRMVAQRMSQQARDRAVQLAARLC